MQDPEADNQATSDLLSRQFTALGAALSDDAPAVRAGAVQGTAALLHRFWELVPAGLSAALLTRLAGEPAYMPALCTVMQRGRPALLHHCWCLLGSALHCSHALPVSLCLCLRCRG